MYKKRKRVKVLMGDGNEIREMYKDVIQVILENEMNNHLGYDKGSNAVKETDKQKHRFQQTIVY